MGTLATISWRSARSHPVRMLMYILAGIVASFFSVGTGAVPSSVSSPAPT